ncbi:MAG: LysM peptidoglycan-binding domain-containing protein, partial [Gammaproteobacteria bacterium]|nr:LysM peptidoglycan-binding domain-containing protein [Gammaproteobacteria bacterium]
MRKNKLYAAMLMLGMANSAQALGLGELNIESSLFQPLHADIEIYGWDRVSLDNLRASLASQNAFLRANIERPFFLRNLKMEVVRIANNDAVIRITSKQPVREPMLDVLIDVQWPGGHLQKQYTIFLDPPITARTLAAEKPPATQARTTSGAAQPAQVPAPQPAVTSAAVAASPQVQTATPSAVESAPEPSQPAQPAVPAAYTVRRGDTLSRIADRFKNPMGVTRDQLMTAIQDANRRAFIAGNINGLMGGMELQIPDAQTVAGRTPEEATALVEQQHQAWRDRNKPQPATTETEVAKAPEDTTGLRLVPTVQEPESQAQPGEEASAARRELTALETELQETRELLYERESELDVMRSRMAVYDAELQDLKQQLEEMRSEVVAKAPVEIAAQPPVESTTQPTDIRTLLIALFAVLGGFGLFSLVYRRLTARAETAEPAAHITPLPLEIDQSLRALEEAEADEAAAAEAEDEPAPAEPQEFRLRERSEVDRDSPTEVREIMADPHPGAETADRMLVEADVLIQFGFYQRGKDLLNEAITNDPGNPYYRLKLMELCQVAEDSRGFREHAELLRERITPQDEELWNSAAQMTEVLFPGDPLFSASDFVARDVVVGGEPTPGTEASWDPASTQEIPKLTDGQEFLNLDEVLETPTDEDTAAKPADWEFQAPPGAAENPSAPARNPQETSEWLLADDQLDRYEQSAGDAENDEAGGAQLRGQVDTSDRHGARNEDATYEYNLDPDSDDHAEDETGDELGRTQ